MADQKVQLDLTLQIAEFKKNLETIENQVNGFSKDFQKNTKGNSQAWNSFVGNLAANAVTAATNAIGNLITSIGGLGVEAIKNAGELESMSVQLGVLLGSAEAGEAQLKSLQQFANSSPFELPGIVEANKLLLAFGTTVKEVPEVLEVLGNIAAGSGKPLSDLARIFGQVQAESKLSLERLNQLNDAGIDLGTTLATKLNIPLSQVREAVTNGKVSFDLFRQSLVQIQSAGGVYANAMVKQSETLEGRLSSLKDNVASLSGSFGKVLFPAVKAGVDILISMVDSINNNMDVVKDFALSLGIVAAGIAVYTIAVNAATIATTAYNIASKLTPWGLAIAGIAALTAGVYLLIKNWDYVKLATLTAFSAIIEGLNYVAEKINSVFGTKIDTSGMKEAIKGIKMDMDELSLKIAQSGQETTEAVKETGTAQITAAERAAQERLLKEKQLSAARAVEARRINEELLLIDQEANIQKAAIAAETLELDNQLVATRAEETIARREAELLATQEFEKAKLDAGINAELQKAALIQDSQEKQNKMLEINQKAQVDRAKLSAKQEVDLSRATLDSKKALRQQEMSDQTAFFGAATSLANSENKKLAIIGKTAAIAEIAMKTPQAIASSFAFGTRTGGPILGAVFAGIAGVAMAAQAAKIAGINFAQGGVVPGSSYTGDRVAANVNSGEMILNKRQQSSLFNLANGGGINNEALLDRFERLEYAIMNQPIVLMADDNEIARSTSRGTMNGIIIGASR